MASTPLVARCDHDEPSVFRPENMLREARRQKGLSEATVPEICVLDPDGDMVRYVRAWRDARRSAAWACYHTEMWEWDEGEVRYGAVGCAVGGSFAVLVAEQLFASGCRLLISLASAGRIAGQADGANVHLLIESAIRDEGTSHHYLPPSLYAEAEPALLALAETSFATAGCAVRRAVTWTTDAPFRETADAIAERRSQGALVVEMEAAALYAFAAATAHPVLCLAHVTNELGCIEGDFDKGEHNGACTSLGLITLFATAWLRDGSALTVRPATVLRAS